MKKKTKQLINDTLKSCCNKIFNGACHNAGCLKRGGYDRLKSTSAPDYVKSTCPVWEAYQDFNKK